MSIIPCGSGNGVVHYLTRSFNLEPSLAALILGRTTPLPVVCARNMDSERSLIGLAIVCVNYGITSDAIVVAGLFSLPKATSQIDALSKSCTIWQNPRYSGMENLINIIVRLCGSASSGSSREQLLFNFHAILQLLLYAVF